MRSPILLNTNPGIDDAIAIIAATFAPESDLRLITTVVGNVSVEKTTRNVLQLPHFWNADTPFAQGAAVPLVHMPHDAVSIYGESGTTGYDFVKRSRQPLGIPAFPAICDTLMRALEPAALAAIGPLASIALLLSQCLEYKLYIYRLVVMGGSTDHGNCTPNAKFNIATGPEAVACVFRSDIEIVMCGLGITSQAILTPDYFVTLPELSYTGKMLYTLLSHYHSGSMQSGLRMHDLCAITWLVRPKLSTLEPYFVVVETQGEFTPGTAVVDIDGCLGKPANVQVVLGLDVKGFQRWVAEVLTLVL